jgi:hypothetical protein
MRRSASRAVLSTSLAFALAQLAFGCGGKKGDVVIVEPSAEVVNSCLESVAFAVKGNLKKGTFEVLLNGESLTPIESEGRGVYRVPVGDALQTDNLLEVRVQPKPRGPKHHDWGHDDRGGHGKGSSHGGYGRSNGHRDDDRGWKSWKGGKHDDDEPIVETLAFTYEPYAYAERVTDEDDLIRGPLAHGRVGDWMLGNCTARFLIQDVAQRDLYSVGAFGGNVIDLELVSRPGLDNFIEISPTLDVETVINAQVVEIVNDGSDGQPASIRTCGPDDLLDFINPSSQLSGIPGVMIPAHADDNDLPIEGCTLYTLARFESRLRMDTTVTNLGFTELQLLVGDWINAGGELENLFTPGDGPGSGLTADLGSVSWFGYGEATGVDYAFTTLPLTDDTSGFRGSFLNTSGVTLSLHTLGIVQAILGTPSPFLVLPGSSRTFTRYLGVGDGSASNAIDMAAAVKGSPVGNVLGCVTVAGAPAPGARVVIGRLVNGEIGAVHTLFTTGEDGCYAGVVPPTPGGQQYAMAASLAGHPYESGALEPTLHPFTVVAGATVAFVTIDLPPAGVVNVSVRDELGRPIPARVTAVGFDPSPEPIIPGGSLFGLSIGDLGLFNDPTDARPFGVTTAKYADAEGTATFRLEPGTYEFYVSRGSEYSLWRERHTVAAGAPLELNPEIARVIETPGFVSSDFHVHGIASADSRVSQSDRVMQFAGEGVENVVMTDHHVHTDLDPRIQALGMRDFLTSTVGEEITSFDYGHWNGYPFTVDPDLPSGGSTDWAQAAPPGMDFPQYGNLNATPAEVYEIATTGPQSLPSTVVQVNHIGSHFSPLKIDTAATPISDGLNATERAALRLPASGNLFHHFDALEIWNGESRGAQNAFLQNRIGIWFNHLNQGLPITFIADTDTHQFFNLNAAGARTWTSSSTDAPRDIDPNEVADAVATGRATGGQGIYVQTRLLARDGSGAQADLTLYGSTEVASTTGDVDLVIDVQAPLWAAYDRIEIYRNATTVPGNPAAPYEYSAVPSLVLTAGVDFDVDTTVVDPGIVGAARLETRGLVVPFDDLGQDSWFVVIVKGSDGVSPPMFPVFPENITQASNTTLDGLTDGNLGESGVMALGATNALYADVDGAPGIQIGP